MYDMVQIILPLFFQEQNLTTDSR